MNHNLSDEENAIIDYVESNPESIDNVAQEIKRYQSIAHAQITKKKAISIQLFENDIELIKAKSLSQGIPFQTLLSALVHQYAQGKIKLES